jgi:class 3 adenylate cyclase
LIAIRIQARNGPNLAADSHSKAASASPTGLVVVGDLIGEGSAQEQSVVGETPNLAAGLQALAAPDAVVIAGQPRSSERLPLTRPAGGTESSQTPRWRKQDSNPRSLSRRETQVRFAADSLVGWWRSARTVRRRLLW